MRLRVAGLSDPGRTREKNEDAFLLRPDASLCFVADGMGGHNAGIVASRLAVERLDASWNGQGRELEGGEAFLADAIVGANQRIFDAAAEDEALRGMGTTVVGAWFFEGAMLVGHVGDSRAYRFRGAALEQITEDHSLVNEYLRHGILTPEQAKEFRFRNVITRAVGVAETVEPEVHRHAWQPGDVVLLCSDGLTDMVADADIEATLRDCGDALEDACQRLVDLANDKGGHDNITVVLVQVS
jgi:protein phosphatase